MKPPPPNDELRLETDTHARFTYLAGTMGLTDNDRVLVRAARTALRERLPVITERLSQAMLERPAMYRHFAPDGGVPTREDLRPHLHAWVEGLVALARDDGLPAWMDHVGATHRSGTGNPQIHVPQVQINALLGLLSDLILSEVASLDLPAERRFAIARAFSKLLWIQNDFLQRHA